MRNNIWVSNGGWQARTWSPETCIDYNGWRHVPGTSSYAYATPSAQGEAASLKEVAQALGWCEHAVTVEDWNEAFAGHRGPELGEGSPMIDAGCRLPTINDDYQGAAPDIGLHERGTPLPHYGPRRRDRQPS